ncbi:haloacid dehalogenase-like hydrolase [Streptomyces sp. ISL-36]|uniref:HAD family hydrolase n=1 Tax=Streptomyces sp. ISL-36 TaxID=2819182 RepID=UPI001BE61E32|nr:haloacid dehalogenase-like hydrolase [Streptomyces sp. ISL-36]MBT2442289.1 haloacid dehalogenase-like hydrolase [Streptomyces sp. ISL-36]
MNTKLRWSAALAALAAVTGLFTAPPAQAKPEACPTLKKSDGWHGDNRARLQELIDAHCRAKGAEPVAVFDWDNTVIKNDVGDATMFWLLRNSRIRPPEKDDWRTTSRHLTDEAADALAGACPTGVRTLPTATDMRCADEILSVYAQGVTTTGQKAFAGFDHRRMEPQYAWLAQLLRGWTTRQVASFAAAARTENLAAPVGAEQRVGTGTVTGWVRYYDQQRDLVRTLQRAGFDVWIVSASPEPVVDVWAQGVGIEPSHALGIRNTTEHGRLTARLKGCGSVPDAEDSMITYIDGKRCWINQEIFGVRGRAAEQVQPAHLRQVFAAGDSDTDVTFLHDATGLRLVLNRNKNELMCRAYDNSDGRWLVNPMFIEPRKRKTSPYPCATTAYTAADGTPQPVRRSDGSVVPDQWDSVFGS